MSRRKGKVCIVVLGDIGRSPRMQYHAASFAEENYDVSLVGYSGSEPIEKLRENLNVKFKYIWNCLEFKNYLPAVLAYALKVLWQTITLFFTLLLAGIPDFLLVQNPPSLPALGVCYVFCRIFGVKYVIDWHNYAYSILALSLRRDHILVRISERFEFYFGRKADGNLCVTKAMKEDLLNSHSIKATTFYDRPPDIFKEITNEDKHPLFTTLGFEYDLFLRDCDYNETIFTKLVDGRKVALRDNRPALLISSTSWTEDEDFSILLTALQEYENAKETNSSLPRLVCAITGKGPLKNFYLHLIQRRKWKHVEVITPWLEAKDYPLFLACGDLGVCLHTSSSGLDLPMKVVDMFGCSLPVCAINFKCISELVQHEKNGFIFNDTKELTQQLQTWFTGFPKHKSYLHDNFKNNLKEFNSLRWHENWKLNVFPLFQNDNKTR